MIIWLQLKSTKQLLGRFGERFLLLGMLAYNKEGKLCLEDADGSVELDFSTLVRHCRCRTLADVLQFELG